MNESAYNTILSDATKAIVILEHLLSAYFDSATPDLDAIRYDYSRIRTCLEIINDYTRHIRTAQP